MNINDAINNLKTRIGNAYDALETRGATVPEKKNTSNLVSTINTIENIKGQETGDLILTGYDREGREVLPSIIKPTLIKQFDNKISYFTIENSLFFLCYDNQDSGIYYSSDGVTWTQTAQTTGQFKRIIYGNGKYVALPENEIGFLYYSNDGINWTKSSKICDYQINDVIYFSNKFIISYYSYINYSTDLSTWTDCSYYPNKGTTTSRQFDKLCVANNCAYVIWTGGTSGLMLVYSTNGLSWNYSNGLDSNVVYFKNNYIRISSVYIYWSTNYTIPVSSGTNVQFPLLAPYSNLFVYDDVCFFYSTPNRCFIYTKNLTEWHKDNFGFLNSGYDCIASGNSKCYYLHSDGTENVLYNIDLNPYNSITKINAKTLNTENILVNTQTTRRTISSDKSQFIGYGDVTIRGVRTRNITTSANTKTQTLKAVPYVSSFSGAGLWYSFDGITWVQSSSYTSYTYNTIIDALDKNTIAMKSSAWALAWSSALTSWSQNTSSSLTSVGGNDIVYSQTRDLFIFAASNGIYYSSDISGQFSTTACTVRATKILENDEFLVAATSSGIWYSIDGKEWVQSNKTDGTFKCFCYRNGVIIAGGDQGIWYSENKGKSWSQTNQTTGTFNTIYYYNRFIIGGDLGILYSNDNGMTWIQSNISNVSCNILMGRTLRMCCALKNQGLWYSTDSGVTWIQSDKTDGDFTQLTTDGNKYLAGGNQGVWYSTSITGDHWQPSNKTNGTCTALYTAVLGNYLYYGTITLNPVTSDIDSNIQAGNIKEGIEILGVTGTLPALNNEEKTVYPTSSIQEITPSTGYSGISKVTVDKVRSSVITTSAETTSKTINATEYSNKNHLFIGTSTGIWYSLDDGVNWIQTNKNSGTVYGLIYANGKFVCASAGLWYSTDGINWSESNKNSGTWYSLNFGNNTYVSCGARSAGIWYSSDGITWVASNMANIVVYDIAYGNGKFIAGSNASNGLLYSSDGVTWYSSNKTDSIFYSVNYCNDKFFAGSSNSGIWYSTDGETWSQTNKTDGGFRSIFYANGKYLAGGSSSIGIWYSTDGISWTQSNKTDLIWRKFFYSGGKYFGCSTNAGVWYSDDGISWTQSNDTSLACYAITGKLVDSYFSSVTVNAVTSTIDSNIQPENIKSGITILGVAGTASTGGITPTGNINITSTAQTDVTNYATAQVVDANLVAGNIKKDVQVLGITGTYEATSTSTRHVYVHANDAENATMQIGTSPSTDISGQELFLDLSSSEYDNKNIVFSSTNDSKTAHIIYENGTTSTQNLPATISISQSFSVYLLCYDYCLDKDTRILLSDNSEKKISELSISDRVMTLNPDTLELEEDELTYCDSPILKYFDEKDIWFFDDGTEITTVRPHEFYNVDKHQFMYIADFEIGNRVYKGNGTTSKLIGHKNIKEKTEHYTIFTKKYNNYFANGILTGNRNSSKIKINLK